MTMLTRAIGPLPLESPHPLPVLGSCILLALPEAALGTQLRDSDAVLRRSGWYIGLNPPKASI